MVQVNLKRGIEKRIKMEIEKAKINKSIVIDTAFLLTDGFMGNLYEDTLAEIERLEGEIQFLRIFEKVIGPPAGNSRKSNSPRKNKKKIGRPTNAEKAAREAAQARAAAKV
jgi:hypothetical protein